MMERASVTPFLNKSKSIEQIRNTTGPTPSMRWTWIPGIPTLRVEIDLKSDVDIQALLADPTAALLHRNEWRPVELFPEVKPVVPWEREFESLLEEMPESTLLRAVDCHS